MLMAIDASSFTLRTTQHKPKSALLGGYHADVGADPANIPKLFVANSESISSTEKLLLSMKVPYTTVPISSPHPDWFNRINEFRNLPAFRNPEDCNRVISGEECCNEYIRGYFSAKEEDYDKQASNTNRDYYYERAKKCMNKNKPQ
ncbi:hypothetical protein TrLO_g2581 [Triparma laevis f. longispina]|uniref:Uncharacterized protein n=1 Tax=Triparma laevis f. longispina TaxID=1714387 RepID=A0A9W6ZTC7_9STRA|nr:hypothetical protein TrLO_g2581 [Triparma laevis f. longispina]